MKYVGSILKMRVEYNPQDFSVNYYLPFQQLPVDKTTHEVHLNPLIGKQIKLSFEGEIYCIVTGEKIKKSYNQGYSYKAFISLAACDICIVKPELCHYHKGTCREPEWGEHHCMTSHIVYLSLSSHLKVGITRESQIPTRFIDQGAIKALPILKVDSRYKAGLIESELKKEYSDVTNWRAMLKGEMNDVDLTVAREQIYRHYGDLIDSIGATDIYGNEIEVKYPVVGIPPKITSHDIEKKTTLEGELMGIKGQYLMFSDGVINMRKYQGYKLKLEY